jgi:hypothetical protein
MPERPVGVASPPRGGFAFFEERPSEAAAFPLLTTRGSYAMRARRATPEGRRRCPPTRTEQKRNTLVTRPQQRTVAGAFVGVSTFGEPPRDEVRGTSLPRAPVLPGRVAHGQRGGAGIRYGVPVFVGRRRNSIRRSSFFSGAGIPTCPVEKLLSRTRHARSSENQPSAHSGEQGFRRRSAPNGQGKDTRPVRCALRCLRPKLLGKSIVQDPSRGAA